MLCTSSRGRSKPRMVKGYARKYAYYQRAQRADQAMNTTARIMTPRPLSNWAEHRNYF